MANVLILDLLEESAYLVRSLLRGKGHSASIAITPEEARAKLETGLFDTIFADLCEPSAANLGVIQFANDVLPGLPTVALTTEAAEPGIVGVDIFGKVFRPIRGSNVNETNERAIQYALNQGVKRTLPRISVDFPLDVKVGEDKFTARATDISLKGFAIDGEGEVFTSERIALLSGLSEDSPISVTMRPSKKDTFTATGKVVFVDSQRKYRGKMIGVVFDEVDEAGKAYVERLFPKEEEDVAEAEVTDINSAISNDLAAAA